MSWLKSSINKLMGYHEGTSRQNFVSNPERVLDVKPAHVSQSQLRENYDWDDQENQCLDHVRFLLLGATGSGKSATIQHLFGHNNDLSEFGLKSADGSSETRETVEYEFKFRRKLSTGDEYHLAETITLGIVDTPGLEDTDGEEQDARNLASIKTFVDQYCTECPNLILFILKADGKRDFGPKSVLAKCLRLYFGEDSGFNLTKDGSNVVIVLTHALNICQTNHAWGTETQEKIKKVQDFVKKQQPGWKKIPPVVALENQIDPLPERMTEMGEWTVFPDKVTWQPKHLFLAIAGVLDANDDGHSKSFLKNACAECRFSSNTAPRSVQNQLIAAN